MDEGIYLDLLREVLLADDVAALDGSLVARIRTAVDARRLREDETGREL